MRSGLLMLVTCGIIMIMSEVPMDDNLKFTKSYDPEKIRRDSTRRIAWLGLLSLGVVILIFWLGLALFPYSTQLPDSAGARPIDWNVLGSLTNLLTTALIMGGLVFAFVENLQNANQRELEKAVTSYNIYKDVFDRFMSPEAQADRRWIILNLKPLDDFGGDRQTWLAEVENLLNVGPQDPQGNRTPGRVHVKNVLNNLDFVGFVANHYWSMENELVFWMSPAIAKVWERIGAYVEEEARLRDEPDYYESAREFADYCLSWRLKHYPKSKIIRNGM